MWRRLLAWLRYADGGPVVEQSAPAEHAETWHARELEIAAIDRAIREELARGDLVAVNALLDQRNGIRPGRDPQVRSSVPVVPGRTT